MKFKVAETTENFPVLRMVSELGEWEVGYVPMLFGYRVRFGRNGSDWVACDLCCGSSLHLRARVLCYILSTLYSADEKGMTEKLATQLFPQPTVKPLDLCPIWQEKLKAVDMLGSNPVSSMMRAAYV